MPEAGITEVRIAVGLVSCKDEGHLCRDGYSPGRLQKKERGMEALLVRGRDSSQSGDL